MKESNNTEGAGEHGGEVTISTSERENKTRLEKIPNEFYNLYSSQNVIFMIKSRRIRRASPITRMGEQRNVYTV
jgi:hypothetical protein